MKLATGSATDTGLVRGNNEDAFLVDGAHQLYAVADGMGGHRGGAVASRLAAERLAASGAQLTDAGAVRAALEDANAALYGAMQDPNLFGMGTTVVGLVLAPRLIWFNVGDSRLYRADGGTLRQLSTDDVPPGPRSGLLTQTLGGAFPPEAIDAHIGEQAFSPARFLLCSDGLTDMLDDAEIAACLDRPNAEAVPRLLEAAMAAGGRDNVSIVLVSVEAGGGPQATSA
jgi:protein phosphatase